MPESTTRSRLLSRLLRVTSAGALVLLLAGLGVTTSVFYMEVKSENARLRAVNSFLEDTLYPSASPTLQREETLVDLLDRAAIRLESGFAAEPEVEAEIRLRLCRSYSTLRLWPEAGEQAESALAIYSELRGDHRETVAYCLSVRSTALAHQGDPHSVALAREALRLQASLRPASDPGLIRSHATLALALWATGEKGEDLAEAEAEYRFALKEFDRHLLGADADRAKTLHSFAAMQATRGEEEEALLLFERALREYDRLPSAYRAERDRCRDDFERAFGGSIRGATSNI